MAADSQDAAELTRISMAIAGEQRRSTELRTIGEWFVSEYEGEIPTPSGTW
ncbi:MAG: hypothetical protein ACLTYN_06720 [Dysosmobacter welbionis]